MTPSAKILADSVSEQGDRVTTFLIVMHRFVLAEFNTHRVLSRNSASSRAIPFEKQMARIEQDLAYPVSWPSEQKGMQGGDELPDEHAERARDLWQGASQQALAKALELHRMGVHKSVVNRLLEPFMWHTAVVTGTAWWNFMEQRCSPLAQPEIHAVATQMRSAYEGSTPTLLLPGQWHTPFVAGQEAADLGVEAATRVSAGRSARTSYLTHDGVRSTDADLGLYERLVSAQPRHWSPLEHPATPCPANRQKGALWLPDADGGKLLPVPTSHLPKVGNLLGWVSLRTTTEAQMKESTYR